MLDQLSWLGKPEELAYRQRQFRGKAAGVSYKYARNVDGLIRTRAIIFLMAVLVFYPLVYNFLFFSDFSVALLVERFICCVFLIFAGFLFNKHRPTAVIIAAIPITLILYTYLFMSGSFPIRTIGFMLAILILVLSGIYHDIKVKQLQKKLDTYL